MKKATSLFILLFVVSIFSNAQEFERQPDKTLQSNLKKANQLFLNKNFEEAIILFNDAAESDSKNYNTQFKLGFSLLNGTDKKEAAVDHLKKATQQMIEDYDFTDIKLTDSPYDALYYLGKSYQATNQPDSALKQFKLYSDHYHGNPPLSASTQIMMCYNAIANEKSPRNVSIKNIGSPVNTASSETSPVVTLDNAVLFFSTQQLNNSTTEKETHSNTNIYLSTKKKNDQWSTPQLFAHHTENNETPLFVSADGLMLYFRKEKKGNGDIYTSTFKDGVWDSPKSLSGAINSSFDETGLSVSGDGQTLYFSSNKDGGIGKSDIYQCKKKKNGTWGKATNLGTVINTPFNEYAPFVHPNGKTLFFSTNGNKIKGAGGYDIYYSELKSDGSWSEPQSLGYPINSSRDELNYYITSGGKRYYSRLETEKGLEIYQIEGGGFDVETLDMAAEVVTLTEEMDVTEVLEVVEEVETEVEVVETVETEVIVENEVEVIDLEAMTELEEDLSSGNLLDETTEESPESMFAQMELSSINDDDRAKLIEKVKNYLSKELENNSSTIFKTIRFNTNSASLDLLNDNEKKVLLDFILNKPKINIKVVGYTDNVGKEGDNLLLSNNRAKVVYDFLIKNGVDKDRIEYYGKGKSNFIDSNATEIGRSKNRRVEVILL